MLFVYLPSFEPFLSSFSEWQPVLDYWPLPKKTNFSSRPWQSPLRRSKAAVFSDQGRKKAARRVRTAVVVRAVPGRAGPEISAN